jgi:inner membrane protein
VVPDLDGFGYPVELLTRNLAQPWDWFHRFHHHLSHNLLSCLLIAAVAWRLGGRSGRVALLALLAALGHLGCDLIGASGPDGYQWPIPFWQPLSSQGWTWLCQWGLSSWENAVITVLALILTLSLAVKRGFSPVELFSPRWDQQVVAALRRQAARWRGEITEA